MFACRTGWGYCEVNPSGLPSPFPVCDSFEFRVAGGQNGYTSHKVCTCLCQPFGFTLSLPARLLASQALKPGEMAHYPLSEKKHRKKKGGMVCLACAAQRQIVPRPGTKSSKPPLGCLRIMLGKCVKLCEARCVHVNTLD